MATENLSPMIAIPYRERTLYIPQQNYGSESRTPDLMVRIEVEGRAITSSTLAGHEEFSEVNTYVYDIKRDIHSDSSRNLHTNAQTFLSDVTFVMPAEPVFAEIITQLLKGVKITTIEFHELQNAADYNIPREKTTFTTCYFTHLQRFTTSWGGNSRINLIICSFRSVHYTVSLDAVDQQVGQKGNIATNYDFVTGKSIG